MTTKRSTTGTEPQWLDDAEMRVWRNLLAVWDELHRDLELDLQHDQGMEVSDYQVLVYLSESPDGTMRMCDLANELNLSPSGLTRRLDGLVKNGWVERRASADDRRVSLAAITERGMDRIVEAAPDHVAHVRRRLFDHLSRTDVERLGNILQRLRAARAEAAGRSLR